MLKLVQHPPENYTILEGLIAKVREVTSQSPGYFVLRQMVINPKSKAVSYRSEVEFFPRKFSNHLKKLEQFFGKNEVYLLDGALTSIKGIEKISVYAEYRNLTERECAAYTKK